MFKNASAHLHAREVEGKKIVLARPSSRLLPSLLAQKEKKMRKNSLWCTRLMLRRAEMHAFLLCEAIKTDMGIIFTTHTVVIDSCVDV